MSAARPLHVPDAALGALAARVLCEVERAALVAPGDELAAAACARRVRHLRTALARDGEGRTGTAALDAVCCVAAQLAGFASSRCGDPGNPTVDGYLRQMEAAAVDALHAAVSGAGADPETAFAARAQAATVPVLMRIVIDACMGQPDAVSPESLAQIGSARCFDRIAALSSQMLGRGTPRRSDSSA